MKYFLKHFVLSTWTEFRQCDVLAKFILYKPGHKKFAVQDFCHGRQVLLTADIPRVMRNLASLRAILLGRERLR